MDLFHDLTWSWIPKAIRINDFSIININTELTKAAPYNFYLSVIFFLNWAATREAMAC